MTSVYFFRLGCGIPWLSWREKQPWNRPAKWPARHACLSRAHRQTAHAWRSLLLECHPSKPLHGWNPHLCFVALSGLPLSGLAGWGSWEWEGTQHPSIEWKDQNFIGVVLDGIRWRSLCAIVVIQGEEMWIGKRKPGTIRKSWWLLAVFNLCYTYFELNLGIKIVSLKVSWIHSLPT